MNKAGFNGIAFSPDGCLLASADAIWDVGHGQVAHMLERGRNDPGPVAFSPDGSTLAVALIASEATPADTPAPPTAAPERQTQSPLTGSGGGVVAFDTSNCYPAWSPDGNQKRLTITLWVTILPIGNRNK